MSVLFDRLCALASADEVLVVLALDAGTRATGFDLPETLTRAAQVPGLDVWLIPPPRPRAHDASDDGHDGVTPTACHRSVADALDALDRGDARSIRVTRCCVSTRDDVPQVRPTSGAGDPLLFVAADRPGWTEQLGAAAGRGIAFSVGAIDPAANFNVPVVDGALAALDALVDLKGAAGARSSSAAG